MCRSDMCNRRGCRPDSRSRARARSRGARRQRTGFRGSDARAYRKRIRRGPCCPQTADSKSAARSIGSRTKSQSGSANEPQRPTEQTCDQSPGSQSSVYHFRHVPDVLPRSQALSRAVVPRALPDADPVRAPGLRRRTKLRALRRCCPKSELSIGSPNTIPTSPHGHSISRPAAGRIGCSTHLTRKPSQ